MYKLISAKKKTHIWGQDGLDRSSHVLPECKIRWAHVFSRNNAERGTGPSKCPPIGALQTRLSADVSSKEPLCTNCDIDLSPRPAWGNEAGSVGDSSSSPRIKVFACTKAASVSGSLTWASRLAAAVVEVSPALTVAAEPSASFIRFLKWSGMVPAHNMNECGSGHNQPLTSALCTCSALH